ncbi:porin [Phaeobacter sp. B1627]|uniref:porin n=1 Tax=Phaeobacter sp. B1627 TaxID=2583809 RepID=UPI0011186EC3|nr:porin [Phaeobacter sp. B1627]TNJ46701.1 porin [Phaeobacter sp. B1627]
MSTKTIAAGSSALALTALLAAPALAGPTYTSDNGGSFRWYGQLNPTFQSYDDGQEEFSRLVDNANSGSRLGFWVEQPFGENTLKFRFETSLSLRSSDGVNQNGQGDITDWTRSDLRHVDLQWHTARAGVFSIGQGSMAADGATGIDLSGTGVAANASVADAAGGYFLRDVAGNLTGVEVGDVFATYDGSRRGRIRYDSPSFAGFTVSASYGEDILTEDADTEQYDIALNYANEDLGDFTVAGALAVNWTDRSGSERRDTIASAAVLHEPTGLSLSVAGGDRDTGGNYGFVKLGYTASLLPVGQTSFSVDYYDGSDMASVGDTAESFGIAAVQKFDKQNLEAYVAYREYSYDDTATTYQDGQAILAGARWKF